MGCKLSLPFLPAWSTWGLGRLEAEGAGPGGGEAEPVKQYSWDRLRVEVDITQYVIDCQEGGEVVRRPGQGRQHHHLLRLRTEIFQARYRGSSSRSRTVLTAVFTFMTGLTQ